jgi:molybdopterin molybdotransferase
MARINVPMVPVSTRDGYLWKSQWGHGTKSLNGSGVYARGWSIESMAVDTDSTRYIATGGVVPPEFDTVVMQEDCVVNNDTVTVRNPEPNKWIRQAGSDAKKGDLLLSKGTVVNSHTIATLIACGVCDVLVQNSEPMIVGVMSNGNELVDITDHHELLQGEVYDSNRHMLINKLRDFPVDVLDMGIARDSKDCIKTYFESAIRSGANVIITSGGTSVGQRDYIPEVIRELGGELLITKINMMPGKPFLFSVLPNGTSVIGLAGNPVSSIVGWELLVKPFFNRTFGLPWEPVTTTAVLHSALKNKSDRPHFMRVELQRTTDGIQAVPTDNQVSSNLKGMINTHGLIKVDPNSEIDSGSQVQVMLTTEDDRMWSGIEPHRRNAKFGIVVASDRASKGLYSDVSGEAIISWINQNFVFPTGCSSHEIVKICVPDTREAVLAALMYLVRIGCTIVFTTGGTGPTERDITAQVTEEFVDKVLPGFGELLRTKSLQYTPTAVLSGQLCGVKYTMGTHKTDSGYQQHGALVLNLPGSPNSIAECLNEVKSVLPKSAEFANGDWLETDPPAFRGRSSKFFPTARDFVASGV